MSPEQVRVDSFLLADAAEAFKGKLYIHGGGWNFLNLSGPNATVRAMAIAGRIIVPWQEANREHAFLIYLEHPRWGDPSENHPLFRILLKPQEFPSVDNALETATPFTFDLSGSSFPEPGEYAFVMRHNGKELTRIRFQVNFSADSS
jgi:hypothetical protein